MKVQLLIIMMAAVGIAATPPPFPLGFKPAVIPVLAPKAAQIVSSLGAPMKKASIFVILPPTITNIVQSFAWNPSPRADGYTVCAGTNHGVYPWTTNVFGTNGTISFKTRDNFEFLYYTVKAFNSFGVSDYSIELRLPDWRPNAVEVSWINSPPNSLPAKPVTWIEQSNDLKHWGAYLQSSPMTNMIRESDQYYRAITQTNRVKLAIRKLWTLDKNFYPPRLGRE